MLEEAAVETGGASAEVIESAMLETLDRSFSGESGAAETPGVEDDGFVEPPVSTYEFDAEFQSKIAVLTLRDHAFCSRTQGLIKPEYFENAAEAMLVNMALEHWAKYRTVASPVAFGQMLKKAIADSKIRGDLKDEVIAAFGKIIKAPITDRDFIAEQAAEFARNQALARAILKSVDLHEKGKYDEIMVEMKRASMVGLNDTNRGYDYFAAIEERSVIRRERVAGLLPPRGITTGVTKLDERLYHRGWGRKELSILMGGAKAGKSTGLLWFAKNAAAVGHNVLYVTLEMSCEIAAERIDAAISHIEMSELERNIVTIEDLVKTAAKKAGKLIMVEYPAGTLTPTGLYRLIESYAAQGIRFDMIVPDYLDLMTPDYRTDSTTENSKNIYTGTRAIAQEEDLAMLSATQTNREGFKSVTAKAEHAADDFNKIRIADLTISINATDEEIERNEARLFFAASRNQRGHMMIQIQRDMERMTFIKSVMGII